MSKGHILQYIQKKESDELDTCIFPFFLGFGIGIKEEKMGYYLKTATLFTNTPHSNVKESIDAPDKRRFRGKRGRRIVFSCTWNENRKKDIEEVESLSRKIETLKRMRKEGPPYDGKEDFGWVYPHDESSFEDE